MKALVRARPEGWKFAGSAGDFNVWHAGKNDYRVSDGAMGAVIAKCEQFGLAHARARREDEVRKQANISAYYSDRANGAHAAKAP